ncbi:MAG: TIGR01777 family oxidoreductase [Thermodesulfobacteriota bacterium]|nr:TIGR01777 family oxidoreductase [Thermodesulfobacteriota bacterium]
MKVFITGGTGFVGTVLNDALTKMGHEVTILTRRIKKGQKRPNGASLLEGDPTKSGHWQEKVGEHETIINLAGASIFTRWTNQAKKEIFESRILTTRHLVESLMNSKGKVSSLLSTSAVGYYGFHGDEILSEDEGPGNDFLAQICSAWEAEALKAERHGIRVVLCRFGIVLGRNGGALARLTSIFKNYLGAPLGSGDQWFSWIHEEDLCDILLFLLKQKRIEGPINCTSPHPVRNKELTKTMGKALHKPTFLPNAPSFILRTILGEFANVLIKGQRVVSQKLSDSGYELTFPTLKEALEDLLRP